MDVKAVIKARGFTIERVASQIKKKDGTHITKGALSKSISNNPTVGTLQAIADVIGCNVGDFFKDEITAAPNDTYTCPHCGKPIVVVLKKD